MLKIIERFPVGPLQAWLTQNRQFLLRALTVSSVLLASAYLARRPSERYLALFLGAGGALVLLRQPLIGLAGVIIGSLIVPFGIGTGSESDLNPPMLLLIVLLGIWLLEMVQRREIQLLPSRTMLPLMALVIVALLSFGVGQLSWFATNAAPIRAQIGGLTIFVLSVSAFVVTSHLIKDLRWLERLTWVFMAIGGFYIACRLVPDLGLLVGGLFPRGANGSLFWTWLVALAFSQAMYNRSLRPHWRLALGLLVLATMYIGLVLTRDWTSGWAPPLLATVVILLVGSPRAAWLVILIGALLVMARIQQVITLVDVGDTDYSIMTRVEAWRILLEIIKVSPILGLGFANYYWYTPLFSILGYYVSFNSHNNYVDLVAQTGLLGLGCFLWFAWETGRLGWRLRSRVPEGFAKAYVYGALGGLAGTLLAGMLGDWVLPFVYNVGFDGFRASVLGWLFLGGLVVIEHIIQQSQSSSQTE